MSCSNQYAFLSCLEHPFSPSAKKEDMGFDAASAIVPKASSELIFINFLSMAILGELLRYLFPYVHSFNLPP